MSQGQESWEKEPESLVTLWYPQLSHGLQPPDFITGERNNFPFGFVHHGFCSGLSKRMWFLKDKRYKVFPDLAALHLHLLTLPPMQSSLPLCFLPSSKFVAQALGCTLRITENNAKPPVPFWNYSLLGKVGIKDSSHKYVIMSPSKCYERHI